jgi:RHS repeat-associated protein
MGSAPSFHTTFNQVTNRDNAATYDANGNDTGPNYNPGPRQYDMDNRLVDASSAPVYGPAVTYGYTPDNKRVLKSEQGDGSSPLETKLYFHGLGGERLGEWRYNFTNSGQTFSIDLVKGNTWFGGKLLQEGDWVTIQDSKGSVRWRRNFYTNATETADYFPFGQEKPGATAQDRQKFGTYLRDAETGLDYADQRYFQNTTGRFMTADPSRASASLADPGSWNRYPYVGGDPVNRFDPNGLYYLAAVGGYVVTSDTVFGIFAQLGCHPSDIPGAFLCGPESVVAAQTGASGYYLGSIIWIDPDLTVNNSGDDVGTGGAPKLNGTVTDKVVTWFKEAYANAIAALKNNDCAHVVYGEDAGNLEARLQAATWNYANVPDGAGTNLGKADPQRNVITLNSGAHAWQADYNDAGIFIGPSNTLIGMTSAQARTWTILHELGHFVVGDGTIDSNNYANDFNYAIFQRCMGLPTQ